MNQNIKLEANVVAVNRADLFVDDEQEFLTSQTRDGAVRGAVDSADNNTLPYLSALSAVFVSIIAYFLFKNYFINLKKNCCYRAN